MLGVRGLDWFGLVHAAFGLAAMSLGLLVLLWPKGTPRHRMAGRGYLVAMLLLNVTSLMIYDLYGGFGPFHVASVLSLATIAAGFVPVWLRRPRPGWMQLHGTFMCWSYVGLLAAFGSEVATRVPGIGMARGAVAATTVVVVAGALVIHTRVPQVVKGLTRRAA